MVREVTGRATIITEAGHMGARGFLIFGGMRVLHWHLGGRKYPLRFKEMIQHMVLANVVAVTLTIDNPQGSAESLPLPPARIFVTIWLSNGVTKTMDYPTTFPEEPVTAA
jgi:hypothetical protein